MKMKRLIQVMACVTIGAVSLTGRGKAQDSGGQALQTVAEFGRSMAIGLSVNSANRLFVSFPNYDGDGKYALAEVVKDTLKAYPNEAWNLEQSDNKNHFVRLQDLFVDDQDNLWVLDSKPAPGGDIFKAGDPKQKAGRFSLIKINTKTDQVEKIYNFPDLDKSVSALNDVRVDTKRQVAYLSDPGQAAIVVLNLRSGRSRTVLSRTSFTLADNIVLRYGGQEMKDQKGLPFSSNVNGIALTHDGQYLYFKPINQESLFRVDTRFLRDASLSEKALETKVEDMGKVGVTHGLIADGAGNIYLTTSEAYSISYLTPDGQLKVLVKDKKLLWPDSMGIGKDGYLYVSCSQLQLLPAWNKGKNRTQYPYRAYRVQLPVK